MSRIVTTAELVGKIDSYQRALNKAATETKRVAGVINTTKAGLNLKSDNRIMVAEAGKGVASVEKLLARPRELKVKVKVDTTELNAVNSKVQRAGAKSQGQLFLQRWAASSGSDPMQNFIASRGVGGAVALGSAKVGEGMLNWQNMATRQDAARYRGDIDTEVEVERERNASSRGIPLVGGLMSALHESVTNDQEELEKLKFEIKLQEKATDQMELRARSAREGIELGEQRIRQLQKENELRDAPPQRRAIIVAREAMLDEVRRQNKLDAIQLDESTAEGRANREVVDTLGQNMASAGQRARAGSRVARTREALERRIAAREEGEATSEAAERRIAGERASRTRNWARQQAVRNEAIREGQELAASRGREIQGRRVSRAREFANLEARRRAGEAGTRIVEMEAGGATAGAAVAAVRERLRIAIKEAAGDPQLRDQAGRQARAELQIIERQAVGMRAQYATDAAFTDLSGRFAGGARQGDPAKVLKDETNKILRDIHAAVKEPRPAVTS